MRQMSHSGTLIWTLCDEGHIGVATYHGAMLVGSCRVNIQVLGSDLKRGDTVSGTIISVGGDVTARSFHHRGCYNLYEM